MRSLKPTVILLASASTVVGGWLSVTHHIEAVTARQNRLDDRLSQLILASNRVIDRSTGKTSNFDLDSVTRAVRVQIEVLRSELAPAEGNTGSTAERGTERSQQRFG